MPGWPASVEIVEVGPRDGLQNESRPIPAADKVRFVEALAAAGLSRIEATAFVHPRWVPQLADAAEVAARLPRRPGVRYSALVPNLKGLARAMDAGFIELAVVVSASEGHSRANLNKPVRDAVAEAAAVIRDGVAAGCRLRAYVSTAFGCPYDGPVAPEQVLAAADRLLESGAAEVALGDTIGVATPRQVRAVLDLFRPRIDTDRLALHFHDTWGTALANVFCGLEGGVRVFDGAAGGLGGCPYAPGAAGNVATEDLVHLLEGMGVRTGVDFDRLCAAGELGTGLVGRTTGAKAAQAHRGSRGAPAGKS